MQQNKTIKDCAKEAKKRMKSGFWQNYKRDVDTYGDKAESDGVERSRVTEYYSDRVKETLNSKDDGEEKFYIKVKNILDTFGEVPDIIGRLTDKSEYNKLSYEEKQRYNLTISERYIKALERYKKEKELKVSF